MLITAKPVFIGADRLPATLVEITFEGIARTRPTTDQMTRLADELPKIRSEFAELEKTGEIDPSKKVLLLKGNLEFLVLRYLATRLPHHAEVVAVFYAACDNYSICIGHDVGKEILFGSQIPRHSIIAA